MMRRNKKSQSGFTIVELLISTSILSVVLVGASFVVVQIGRLYYKGVITSRTQATARNLVDTIARPLQLNGSNYQVGPTSTVALGSTNTRGSSVTTEAFCIGQQRFTYVQLMRVQQSATTGPAVIKHGLWADTVPNAGACPNDVNLSSAIPSVGGSGLIGENMQLLQLQVQPNGDLYTVSVVVAYAPEPTDIDYASSQCRANIASSQFCAVAKYETTISPR